VAETGIDVKITGTASGVQEAMTQATAAVQQGTDKIKDSFRSVETGLGDLKSQMTTAMETAGIYLMIEAFEKLASSVMEAGKTAVEIHNMSEVLGVTAVQFQAMKAAADEAGVGTEKLFRATERMVQLLDQARDGSGAARVKLSELGITLEQVRDPTFNTAEMLAQLSDNLNDSSRGVDVMNALVKEFGPRAALTAEAIKNLAGNTKEWGARVNEINGFNTEQIEKLRDSYVWWTKVGEVLENTKGKVIIASTEIIKNNEVSRLWAATYEFVADKIGWVTRALTDQTAAMAANAAARAEAQAKKAQEAAAAEEAAVKKQQKLELEAVEASTKLYKEGSQQRVDIAKAATMLTAAVYGEDSHEFILAQATENEAVVKSYAERDRLKAEETRKDLQREREKLAELKAMGEAQKKVLEDTLREQRAWALETQRIETDNIATKEAVELEALASAMDMRRMLYTTGRTTRAQELADELTHARQVYGIQAKAVADRIKEYASDPVMLAKSLNDQKVLVARYAHDVAAIQAQMLVEEHKYWGQFFDGLQSGFQNVLGGLLNGTKTMADTVRGLFAAVLDAITNTLAAIAAEWLVNHIKTMIMGKVAAVSQISANAGIAATAAMGSVAAIPFYGWAMAPGVGAATFANAMAYQATAAAAGGFDIPAGMNPVTQLHQKEMVLPSKYADVIRGMGDQMGRRSQTVVHLPAASIGDVFLMNRDALKKAITAITRDGSVRFA